MTELDRIKGRCHIDEITGCWEWRGSTTASNGGLTHTPRAWTTDYTLDPTGQTKTVQTGNRAAWHAHTGQPIPQGHRVYKNKLCANGLCVNPAHLACGTDEQWGKAVAKKGIWKNSARRIKANRATGRKNSHVTPEILAYIQSSEKTGVALAAELGIKPSVVSNARRGRMKSIQSRNPFAGLMV